jgi:superfamily II RNA helicase
MQTKNYHRGPFRPHKKKRRPRAPKIPRIKPRADTKLKKVFAQIGVPPQTPFKPDRFQIEAVEAIQNADCLVTAPTGAGKTWIAVEAISRFYDTGGRCWYASPLKALSNAKYTEFGKIFGTDNVGILTGDRKEKPDASVIVGTTEILRNQLYDAMHQGIDLATDFVVLDEAHYLGDEDRGVVWEEVMIYLPARIPLLLLSATVGNARQIAGWLASIRRKKCIVVEESLRPVPLYPLFLEPQGTLFPLLSSFPPQKRSRLFKGVRDYLNKESPPQLSRPGKLPPFGEVIRMLRKYHLLPVIFFLKSRADCDNALDLCLSNQAPQDAKRELRSRRIEELVSNSAHIKRHRHRWKLEHLAVAPHHSGHLPAWKILVETLMSEGLLDAVFATSTVAAGVNFPARTIVILNSDRFNGTEFLPLTATQFHQMTGRAGRRGMDNIGFALSLPGKFMDIRHIARLCTSPSSGVNSQIKINFSMVLNLLLSHTPADIQELLHKSFANYQLKGRRRHQQHLPDKAGQDDLWQDFLRHLRFLKEQGYVTDENRLSTDGSWASQLRVDQPLLIAEGFRLDVLPKRDPAMLAAVIASFVNDRESDDRFDHEMAPQHLLDILQKIMDALSPFAQQMISRGFEVHPLLLRPAAAVYAWAVGQSWEKICTRTDIAEGDMAMLVLRTADNLRHICALREIFPEAAKGANLAIDMILKDPILPLFTEEIERQPPEATGY